MSESSPNLDLRFFLAAVLNGRWVVLGITALALCAGLASTWFQELRYESWAQLQIDPPPFLPNPGSDLGAQNAYYWAFDKYFKTEKEKLNSPRLRRTFAELLKTKDSSYSGERVDSIAAEFAGGFRVEPVEDTNLVTAFLVTDRPEKSAEWLNTYIDAYVQQNAKQQEENVRQSREVLKRQLDEIKTLLESQSGSPSGDITSARPPDASDSEMLIRYQSAYEDVRKRRMDEERKYNRLEPFLRPGADLSQLPNFEFASGMKPLLDRCNDAEASVQKLRREGKGMEHPAVVARRAEIDRLREQVLAELQKTGAAIKIGIGSLQASEDDALRSLRRKQSERVESSRQLQEVQRLTRSRDTWANSMAIVEDKLRSLKIMESFVSNNISVTERPRPDSTPVYRRGIVFLVMAGMAGFFAGMCVVVAREFMNPRVRSVEEISTAFDVPALGYLPHVKDFAQDESRESYNVLRTELLFRREAHKQHVIMVTSSIPQEGKTTVALNLAKILAEGGDRTVVIDFDLRKARLRSLTSGGGRDGERTFVPVPGLTLRLDPVEGSNLHVIVPVVLPDNPPYVLSQTQLRDFVDHLRARYHWVLIDTPPVTSVTDAVIVASLVDSVLFVIKHDAVDKRLVRDSLAALTKVNSAIAGAILNDLNMRKSGYYRYRSYYRYHKNS